MPDLETLATSYGGLQTFKFNQMNYKISKDKVTKNGICLMLAATYIADLAEGKQFHGRFQGNSNHDNSMIGTIATMFKATSGMTSHHQHANVDQWLKWKKLHCGKQVISKGSQASKKFYPSVKPNFSQVLSGLRHYTQTPPPLYCIITIGGNTVFGGKVNHALGLCYDRRGIGPEIRFFDPNKGVFHFNQLNNFTQWFPRFVEKCYGYSMSQKFSTRYYRYGAPLSRDN